MSAVMSGRLDRYVRLAYGFSWLIWAPAILASRGMLVLPEFLSGMPGPVGTYGPLLAVLAVLALVGREGGLSEFFRRGVSVAVPWYCWLAALLMWRVIPAFGVFFYLLVGACIFGLMREHGKNAEPWSCCCLAHRMGSALER
ncbi:MAG: hypothetical protein QGI81_01040 [Pseudomonadales bacterium]|nr:hypothetical protein [Pseudomonadales bacterium]